MSVPAQAQVTITLKADNWAFGSVEGRPRGAAGVSDRPQGTERPSAN